MTKLKIGNAIACEYIAEGQNGKITLVNAWSGDLLVLEFPSSILIAFYVEITSDETKNLYVNIKIDLGKNQVGQVNSTLKLVAGETSVIILPAAMLHILEKTEIKVTLSTDEIKPMTLIKRKIKQGTLPNLRPTT